MVVSARGVQILIEDVTYEEYSGLKEKIVVPVPSHMLYVPPPPREDVARYANFYRIPKDKFVNGKVHVFDITQHYGFYFNSDKKYYNLAELRRAILVEEAVVDRGFMYRLREIEALMETTYKEYEKAAHAMLKVSILQQHDVEVDKLMHRVEEFKYEEYYPYYLLYRATRLRKFLNNDCKDDHFDDEY